VQPFAKNVKLPKVSLYVYWFCTKAGTNKIGNHNWLCAHCFEPNAADQLLMHDNS
jgi:hypothetical protein